MNRDQNQQLTDIINCAIAYVNGFPELKQHGSKVDIKDCWVEPEPSPHIPEIGGSAITILPPSKWQVHIISDIFPGPHPHYIAIVEREVGGSLAVTHFFPG